MIRLDRDAIRSAVGEAAAARLADLEVFPEIESTNSYLMLKAGPTPGYAHVAITDNQTKGRGRHGRTWTSPPGSGLCLSIAYTFESSPDNLPALTLAMGLGAIDALEKEGVRGVQLKWPNDLMAADGKLGGILTESRLHGAGAVTIVTGIGINMDLGEIAGLEFDSGPVRRVADLASFAEVPPRHGELAVRLIDSLCSTYVDFETAGFDRYARRWSERDWLYGREVVIDAPQRQVSGRGAGIGADGALLVDTGGGQVSRVTSGSVVLA